MRLIDIERQAREKRKYELKKDIEKGIFISKLVAGYYLETLYNLFPRSRKRHLSEKRQIIHYFCKKYTNLSWDAIGKLHKDYGIERDHATVMHSYKTVENLIQSNKKIAKDIQKIEDLISVKLIVFKRTSMLPEEKELYEFRMNVIRACRISFNKQILQNELIAIL